MNTYQHAQHTAQTHRTTKHFFFSSCTGSLYSMWHEACTGIPRNVSCMMRTCSPNEVWATVHAFWPSRQVRAVCTEGQLWECSLLLLLKELFTHHTTPHHTRNTAGTLRHLISAQNEQFARRWRAKAHGLWTLRVSVFCTRSWVDKWSLSSSLGEMKRERRS